LPADRAESVARTLARLGHVPPKDVRFAGRSRHDGEPGEGPISRLDHVRGYPTVYVIDAEGKIRSKNARGDALDQLVEQLVSEREAAGR